MASISVRRPRTLANFPLLLFLSLGLFNIQTPKAAEQSSCTENVSTNRKRCDITEPDVTVPQKDYPGIRFSAGDRIFIHADGCVQTGGRGRTWKDYVYPTDDNPSTLYHGRIRIPGATLGPETVRFKDVQGNLLTMLANSEFLTLGYEDDNYSDNGYSDHDDGTQDQCAVPVPHT